MDERGGRHLYSDILCRCNGRRRQESNAGEDSPGFRWLQFLYGLHLYYFASLCLRSQSLGYHNVMCGC